MLEETSGGKTKVENIEYIKNEHFLQNIYCSTVKETVESSLSDEQLLYVNQLGAIKLEVPFDQYDEVVAQLTVRLQNEELAKDTVKQGAFTYRQVRYIAEAGLIEGLILEESGRVQLQNESLGMSAAIAFAQSAWNGATREEAVENAVYTGLNIVGEAVVDEILANDMQDIELDDAFELGSGVRGAIQKNGAKVVAKKAAGKFTHKAMISSLAAKKTILLLNANVVTGALVTGVLSTLDISRAVKGEMSKTQLFKNITKTAANVAGSIGGMAIGASIGVLVPWGSTSTGALVGGIVGLIIGSILTSKIAGRILDRFIEDDAKEMLDIFEVELEQHVYDHLLNELELQKLLDIFKSKYKIPKLLRNMFKAENREQFSGEIIQKELINIYSERKLLKLPTISEIYKVLLEIK